MVYPSKHVAICCVGLLRWIWTLIVLVLSIGYYFLLSFGTYSTAKLDKIPMYFCLMSIPDNILN